MSSLAFNTAQAEVAGQTGLDVADTNIIVRLKRWLNLAYHDIEGFYEWSWLKDRESVVTVSDYTTGTVSATAADDDITFSAVIAASKALQFIQFSSANDWYKILTHTAGTNVATVSPNYAQTSNLVAGTYTIRKVYYSLSSSAEYVMDCRQAISQTKLTVINAKDYDLHGFPTATGNPTHIVFWGMDTSNNWVFTPYPFPTTPMILEFRILKRITELSGDSDTAIFPTRFNSVWLNRAKMYAYEFLNDKDMYAIMRSTSDKDLTKLKAEDNPSKDEMSVLEPYDNARVTRFIRFPSNFGDI